MSSKLSESRGLVSNTKMSPCFHSFQEPVWKLIKTETCLWSGSNMRGGSRHRKPGRHRERKGRVAPPSPCPGNSKLEEYWQKDDTAKKQHLTCNLTLVQIKVFWWKTMEDLYGKKNFYKWEMLWCKYWEFKLYWEKLFVSKNGQMKSDCWYKFVKIRNLL